MSYERSHISYAITHIYIVHDKSHIYVTYICYICHIRYLIAFFLEFTPIADNVVTVEEEMGGDLLLIPDVP